MKNWKWWQKTLLAVGVLLLLAGTYIFWPQGVWPFTVNLDNIIPEEGTYEVEILRDVWGVPHIYGRTDADAAYGLAYAHAEDDFATIQDTILASSSMLGRTYGADSAPIDYFAYLLRVQETVAEKYSSLPPESQAILDAYADGLNHYAALHTDEVLTPELYPLTGEDIAAANLLIVPIFFGLDSTVGDLFAGPPEEDVIGDSGRILRSPISNLQSPNLQSLINGRLSFTTEFGSNVFAVSPARSANGETMLAVNSHQPWSGPAAWYEAHLHSEEGLNMVGGLFPTSPLVILGHNENLGWSFTVNSPDLVDTYQLEINPDNADQYKFDDQWLDLEVRKVTLWVNIIGRLNIPVRQETLWSVYGPTIRQEYGTYAVRYAGMGEIDLLDQFRKMNKATTFVEWQDAMRNGPLPMFNVGYADDQGNIFYVYNASLPIRNEEYDWSGMLPGNTSQTLWTEYLPYDDLPQMLNPASGFIQNSNSSPFQTTLGDENPNESDFSPTWGIETEMSNRALRALQLFGENEAITADDFYAIKYDMEYAPESDVAKVREMLLQNPPTGVGVDTAVSLLADWNLQATPESEGATIALLTFYNLVDREDVDLSPSKLVGGQIPLAAAQAGLLDTVAWLQENYGRINVEWQEVNRLSRGEADLGMGGGPDLLHAIYGEMDEEDGRLHAIAGDSYIQIVQWDADGNLSSQSIHQYGSATSRPESPHYADQAPLFANRQLKPVWITEEEIRANLERAYVPGE